MATLSVTTIGHNEAEHLRELLPRLAWADEVVYVDCESTDGSLEIARGCGCRTFSRPNNLNLNINKSFGIEQATGDWIFYLDPDERLPEELVQEVCAIRDSAPSHAAFRLSRRNHYFGRWLRHGSQYPDTQLRLFRAKARLEPSRHGDRGRHGRQLAPRHAHCPTPPSASLLEFDLHRRRGYLLARHPSGGTLSLSCCGPGSSVAIIKGARTEFRLFYALFDALSARPLLKL
jgi:glycosyltransferase involved in cell wall biosynthesis